MGKESSGQYGPTVLRIALGLLFIVPGVGKLMSPAVITGMLGSLGFPAPAFWAWVLLLSEIMFGLAVLLGWQLNYTVWPLVIIMVVATVTVYVPKLASDPMAVVTILFHVLAIAALGSLYLTGAGAKAVDKAA